MVRDNPHWISKGCSRSIRNAIKARLPVQLFKTALQKAIASGEAKQSAIVEAQKACGQAYIENADPLGMTKNNALRSLSLSMAKVIFGMSPNGKHCGTHSVIPQTSRSTSTVR